MKFQFQTNLEEFFMYYLQNEWPNNDWMALEDKQTVTIFCLIFWTQVTH